MKELSIEEKAKAYDEAKLRMSRAFNSNRCSIDFMNEIFPELKENEDERIRKELITQCRNTRCVTEEGAERIAKWIAWLEKQGEQKPAWSEEDEWCLENAIKYCEWARDKAPDVYCYETSEKSIDWLKSLKPQNRWKPSDEHYELEEFAKIVRCNLTGISKAVQELFEAKYLQLTGNKMYRGFKD
jgi:hypothetical protein